MNGLATVALLFILGWLGYWLIKIVEIISDYLKGR